MKKSTNALALVRLDIMMLSAQIEDLERAVRALGKKDTK